MPYLLRHLNAFSSYYIMHQLISDIHVKNTSNSGIKWVAIVEGKDALTRSASGSVTMSHASQFQNPWIQGRSLALRQASQFGRRCERRGVRISVESHGQQRHSSTTTSAPWLWWVGGYLKGRRRRSLGGGGRWGRHSTVPLQLARRQSGAYKGWSGHDVYMVYSLASTGVFGFLAYFLRG